MVKTIGYNRFLFIAILALTLVALFFYTQYVQTPSLQKEKRKLSTVQSETSEMRNNVDRLRNQLDQFEKEKADFARVQSLGFFDGQDRIDAKQLITAIQNDSKLVNARYSIKPVKSVVTEKSREAGYKILATDIDFNLEAIEDADIYQFIHNLNYGFPGLITIKKFTLDRTGEITPVILRKIGTSGSEVLVKSQLNVSWYTMVADETLQKARTDNEGGEY